MPCCAISCMISAVFVIGMIYFYHITDKNAIVKQYKEMLSPQLQKLYAKITQERRTISYYGYGLGLLLSLCLIFYYIFEEKDDLMNLIRKKEHGITLADLQKDAIRKGIKIDHFDRILSIM